MIARPHDAHSVQHEFDFPPTILFPGTNDDPRLDTAERITLRDYYTACILPDVEGQLSDRSLASDRNALNHWEARTANPDIREISRDHLLQLCDSIDQDELSPKTRDKILRELNAMLFDACEEGYIHRVPAIPKRLKRRRRSAAVTIPRETVTMAEVESLWKACRHATYPAGGHYPAPRFWRVMIVLFYVYGQRTCDCLRLTHKHLRMTDRVLLFQAKKTHKLQGLPLTGVVLEHLRSIRSPAERLFPGFNSPGHKNKRGYYHTWTYEICANASLNAPITFKHFRQSMVTRYNGKSNRPNLGGWIAGHSISGVTAQHYDNPTDDIREAIEAAPIPECFQDVAAKASTLFAPDF